MRSNSVNFNKYEISDSTLHSTRRWQDNQMYKTSYFKMSEKNVKYYF